MLEGNTYLQLDGERLIGMFKLNDLLQAMPAVQVVTHQHQDSKYISAAFQIEEITRRKRK